MSARGLARQLEGWPLALWVVGAGLLSAWLVVPRDVPPEYLPPPFVDRPEQRRAAESEHARAARARAGLPREVRAVGEAYRRRSLAAAEAPELAPQLTLQLRRLAAEALERLGPEPLLQLRALQAELFLEALGQSAAAPSRAALELGGRLAREGFVRGWFTAPPGGATADERQVLFRLAWAESVGLGQRHPFSLTLNEWRAYYRFLLGRPLPEPPERERDLRRRLEYVGALASHDPDYPSELARGILLYQAGSPTEAAGALRRHLLAAPEGPWALRAKNHLAACGARLSR